MYQRWGPGSSLYAWHFLCGCKQLFSFIGVEEKVMFVWCECINVRCLFTFVFLCINFFILLLPFFTMYRYVHYKSLPLFFLWLTSCYCCPESLTQLKSPWPIVYNINFCVWVLVDISMNCFKTSKNTLESNY